MSSQHTDQAPHTVPALVKTGLGASSIALVQRPIQEPTDSQVLLEILATGVCGTDLHIIDDEYASAPPVTMGHEVAGRVVAVGSGVDSVWLDKRVVVETYFSACETCDQCRAGLRNLCLRRRSIGSFADGGFSTHMVVPALNLHEVPEHISDHAAALCEPLACVCRCLLDPAVMNVGDDVLVTGPGAMGLLAAQVALAQGARVVVAGLPKDGERLKLAENFCASTLTEPPVPRSFDVVIECSGSAAGAAACLSAAKPSARYVGVGIFGRPVTIDFDMVLYKELTITSGFATTPTAWRRAMSLLHQKQIDLEPLVGRVARLEDFESVLAEVRAGSGLKTVIDPRRGAVSR
jgi:L-iditol 2-dehydrogenase